MNESKKTIITIAGFVLVALGLCAAIYFQMTKVGISPFDGDPESIRAKVDRYKVEIKRLEDVRDIAIPAAKKELKSLRGDEKVAKQLLPSHSYYHSLVDALKQKAKDAKIDINTFRPTVRPADANLQEWAFRIDVVGSYDEIGTFVNKMEEFKIAGGKGEERFFEILDIQIGAAEGGMTENGRHNCTLSMRTYRYTGEDKENL